MTPPQKFLRSRDDRVLSGVAGGLGKAFGVDAMIFRIALAALIFVGGVGLLVYAAALVLVPADDGTGRPSPRGAGGPKAAAITGIGLAALAGLALAFWGSAWATAAGGGVIVAGVVLALGAALVAGSVRGDRRVRWLALPALVIALPAGVVSAADISLDGGVGKRSYRPVGADVLPGGYELGAGELTVDLRGLDWRAGERRFLALDVGVGHAVVLVPESVCVGARSAIGMGYADVLSREAGGIDVTHDVARTPAAGAPALALEVHMGMGALEVLHRDPEQPFDGPGRFRQRTDTSDGAVADRACAGDRR